MNHYGQKRAIKKGFDLHPTFKNLVPKCGEKSSPKLKYLIDNEIERV